MALQVGIHKFTGRLDNVIGYRRNGRYFFRSMPDKVRQTAATKRAARSFGIASRKGKLIRSAFRPHLDVRYDCSLVNRLNKLVIQAGRNNFPDLQGFHFNRHTGLEKLFTIPLTEGEGIPMNTLQCRALSQRHSPYKTAKADSLLPACYSSQ